MARQSYLQIDFSNFDAKGLKPIVAALGRSKVKVILDDKGMPKVSGTNRITRRQGVPTKTATIFLLDGQKLMLSATSEGAIYQVKLNSTIIPVRNKDDLGAAVKEVAAVIRGNSKSFVTKLAAKTVKKHAEDASPSDKSTGTGGNSIPARLKRAKAQFTGLQEEIDAYQEVVQVKKTNLGKLKEEANSLSSAVETEKARRESLSAEIAELT